MTEVNLLGEFARYKESVQEAIEKEAKWTERYMRLAQHVAEWSQDPSTKVGAVVIGADRRRIALGYNGFPPGIRDDGRLQDREVKYRLIQHAERNALDNAAFDLGGGTLAVTLHPCCECAKSIITRGIRRVICPMAPTREPWAQSSKWAAEVLREAGVELIMWLRDARDQSDG